MSQKLSLNISKTNCEIWAANDGKVAGTRMSTDLNEIYGTSNDHPISSFYLNSEDNVDDYEFHEIQD